MVWIYGGGFQFGSSNLPLYNGTNLAEQDVIVVTFNYRLRVFGFLGLAELDQQGTPSGDYGLQDQLTALRWVKENIAAYGGDPDNATIFGQSAGAHSIGLLLASPLSAGLFHKAILESGAYWDKSLNNAALWNASTDPSLKAFAPSIDNYVVPTVPAEVFNSGGAQKVPLLAGFTAAEEDAFLPQVIPHSTPAQYDQSAKEAFGVKANAFLSLYPGDNDAQANQSALALLGDLVIREQTFEALYRQYSANGQDVYAYYYTYNSSYSPVPIHTAEICFVWGNLGFNPLLGNTSPPTSTDVAFSKTLMAYWTGFAKTGNPNNVVTGLPNWPLYTGSGKSFLDLGQNIIGIANPDAARFHLLSKLRTNGTLPMSWRSRFTNNRAHCS
ncbi:hypothetical protein LTR35_017662 [Friedmanniomyces endolithicus]|uniref:Carboxylesterase type B domain-containing protein n=1 Tax=Friedmanniomyces endolithicus TaxID=329885 RepID=A0AAN6F7C8_9PEZI|nr:hypothetical protein LTR35_017662 [Friedmanniomyces endolithicus]KAK0268356.1 hypothetical protein LTS00_017589 [Friedmanniomyces endolithicus]KAK0302858.1 hypothetical protein LTR82_017736 [Friedmanniomyces endolithicus]